MRSTTSSDMMAAFGAAGLKVFERGWLSSNNVLFDGTEPTLIDTGYAVHSDQTLALVRSALQARPLVRIINTHLHSDHCGGNRVLQDMYGCEILVPAGESGRVDRWDQDLLSFRATGQRCDAFRRTGSVQAGQDIQLGPTAWRVIASPGHDPMSVMLHEPGLGVLISADALWSNGLGVVFPELDGEDAFASALATLDTIADLHVRWVIPGHGPVFSDVDGAVARARRRGHRFIDDPLLHARHAAKVLMVFRLLETHRESRASLSAWIRATPYLRRIHACHFADQAFDTWWCSLLDELTLTGAVRCSGHDLVAA